MPLGLQRSGDVEAGLVGVGLEEWVQVLPALGPHVAQHVRRDRGVEGHLVVAVLLVELGAHVAMELLVERADLVPQAVDLVDEGVGVHVVAAAPEVTDVGVADLGGALVAQLHEALVERAHGR